MKQLRPVSITGGRIVTPEGVRPGTLRFAEGLIVSAEDANPQEGDEVVDAALGREAVDPLLERRIVGDVEDRPLDASFLRTPFLLALLHELGVARAEAHDRPFGDEGIDDGAADALGATRDQYSLVLQPQVHGSSAGKARL